MSKAIFLGSFDPPHIGHTSVIKSVIDSGIMEELGIDKIHIIPTSQNPNKKQSTSFNDRYKMCIKEFGDFIYDGKVLIDDIENTFDHQYTYELIERLHSGTDEYIKGEFWWIITFETYNELLNNEWKESKYLLDNNPFIIVLDKDKANKQKEHILEHRCIGLKFIINNDYIKIHSKDIRNSIKTGDDSKLLENFMNHQSTIDFIRERKLYIYD